MTYSLVTPSHANETTTKSKRRGSRFLAVGIAGAFVLATFVGGMGATASAAPTAVTVAVGSEITLSAQTATLPLAGGSSSTVATDPGTGISYNVLTNNLAGYSVTVQASAATLTPTTASVPVNGDSIPIANLAFRESGASLTWVASSATAAVPAHTQATRSVAGGDTWVDEYQITIPFVNQDTYGVTLNYIAAVN